MHALAHRSLWLVAAALLVASLVLPAHAQRRPQQAARGFPAGLAEVRLVKEKAEQIGVDEETLKKLDALSKETRAKEQELRARILEATQKVSKLLDENLPDEKAVLEASAEASGISRETRVLRLQCSLKLRALLTKEQLDKFMEIRKKAMSARRARGQRPRG
jgi:Spy/CpxP family protein refolding chaperone